MTRWRHALLLVTLFAASSAFAGWYPSFSSKYEELTVGETKVIQVHAIATGLDFWDFSGWICVSTKESVAQVEGRLLSPTGAGKVRITAIAPGEAWVRVRIRNTADLYKARYVHIVVRPTPLSVSITPSTWITKVGQPVTLTAIAEGSPHTFRWYSGLLGDLSHPLEASGNEVTVTPLQPGMAYYWVAIEGAQGTSGAEIAIEVKPAPRRRGVSH
jgi:hypothetical protein